MKKLITIAGANGAGKSTHGRNIIEALLQDNKEYLYIDSDEFNSLLSKEETQESYIIKDSVEEHFVEKSKEAIKNQSHFVYESNLVINPYKDIQRFKQAKYQTNLIFFCVEIIEDSISWVKDRVNRGGHEVSIKDIKTNFKHGYINLEDSFRRKNPYFDTILLYELHHRQPVLSVVIKDNEPVFVRNMPNGLKHGWTPKPLYSLEQCLNF